MRLEMALSPYRLTIWLQLACALPAVAGWGSAPAPALLLKQALVLACLPFATMVLPLLVVPLAHPLPLFLHAPLQLAWALRLSRWSRRLCCCCVLAHGAGRRAVAETTGWLHLLGLFCQRPLLLPGELRALSTLEECQRLVSMLQLFLGAVVSITAQAAWERRVLLQPAGPARQAGQHIVADSVRATGRVFDTAGAKLSRCVEHMCRVFSSHPCALLLVAAALWGLLWPG